MSAVVDQSVQGIVPGVSQNVAIGASSAQSAVVGANTTAVLLTPTVACFVSVGTSPTAVANTSLYLPANSQTMVGIVGGQKVAVIQASGAGVLYITEAA